MSSLQNLALLRLGATRPSNTVSTVDTTTRRFLEMYNLPPLWAPEPSEEDFYGFRYGESAHFPDPGAAFALPPEDLPAIVPQMISDETRPSPSTKDPDDTNLGDEDEVLCAFLGLGYSWPSPTHTVSAFV